MAWLWGSLCEVDGGRRPRVSFGERALPLPISAAPAPGPSQPANLSLPQAKASPVPPREARSGVRARALSSTFDTLATATPAPYTSLPPPPRPERNSSGHNKTTNFQMIRSLATVARPLAGGARLTTRKTMLTSRLVAPQPSRTLWSHGGAALQAGVAPLSGVLDTRRADLGKRGNLVFGSSQLHQQVRLSLPRGGGVGGGGGGGKQRESIADRLAHSCSHPPTPLPSSPTINSKHVR